MPDGMMGWNGMDEGDERVEKNLIFLCGHDVCTLGLRACVPWDYSSRQQVSFVPVTSSAYTGPHTQRPFVHLHTATRDNWFLRTSPTDTYAC